MRVTHVITRLIVGGAQENTIATVLGLRERGIQTHLVSGPTTGPEGSLESLVAPLPGFTLLPSLVRPVNPWLDWRARQQLAALFRKQRPDIVHTHSGKAGILGRLAASSAAVPVIVHTVHGPSFGPFQGTLANTIFRSAEKRAARVTTHFVVVAQAMADQYLAAGIGHPQDYTRVFSGFDLQPFLQAPNDPALRAKLGIAPDDFVVGKVARLFKLKGHDDLLDAAPGIIQCWPKTKFVLLGDGAWRGRLEERVRKLKLERHFVFAGLVQPGEVPRWIGMMDAVVHLSRREGLPRVLPQGLAAAKPVVAYDCDGASEVCLQNETGCLIPPGDLQQLQSSLVQLASDPQLRRRLGLRGQQLAKECFPVEKMVDDLRALYERLWSRARGRD